MSSSTQRPSALSTLSTPAKGIYDGRFVYNTASSSISFSFLSLLCIGCAAVSSPFQPSELSPASSCPWYRSHFIDKAL
ncbi:hypothetical protein BJX63DRAFT_410668 [Aspergillus granulosus]|uniref:Uncharacterized protein n=1 Tax=Aspergillus granulosus TaxID=176169 RepID=A0ABR4GXT8_9EURO